MKQLDGDGTHVEAGEARLEFGKLVGAYTDWTPLADRGWLFTEGNDRDDPW